MQIVEKLGVLVVVAEHERLLHLGRSDIALSGLDAQQKVDLSLRKIRVLGDEEFQLIVWFQLVFLCLSGLKFLH